MEDFMGKEMYALQRASPFPLPGRPYLAFDQLTTSELELLRAEALVVAELHGHRREVSATSSSDVVWLYSDPALEEFNTLVPTKLVEESVKNVVRASVGLVQSLNGWTTMERVKVVDREVWLGEKRSGGGRDPRVSGRSQEAGRPLFREAVKEMKPQTMPGNIFVGPPAVKEVTRSVVSSGHEPAGCQSVWETASGVARKSGICMEHALLLTLLWIMATVDLIDLFNSSAAEFISRRILMIEKAVKRNPRQPDFTGLDAFLSHALDPGGGVLSPELDKHIAELQKAEAMTMKSYRQNREEQEADSKRKNLGKKEKEKDP